MGFIGFFDLLSVVVFLPLVSFIVLFYFFVLVLLGFTITLR